MSQGELVGCVRFLNAPQPGRMGRVRRKARRTLHFLDHITPRPQRCGFCSESPLRRRWWIGSAFKTPLKSPLVQGGTFFSPNAVPQRGMKNSYESVRKRVTARPFLRLAKRLRGMSSRRILSRDRQGVLAVPTPADPVAPSARPPSQGEQNLSDAGSATGTRTNFYFMGSANFASPSIPG